MSLKYGGKYVHLNLDCTDRPQLSAHYGQKPQTAEKLNITLVACNSLTHWLTSDARVVRHPHAAVRVEGLRRHLPRAPSAVLVVAIVPGRRIRVTIVDIGASHRVLEQREQTIVKTIHLPRAATQRVLAPSYLNPRQTKKYKNLKENLSKARAKQTCVNTSTQVLLTFLWVFLHCDKFGVKFSKSKFKFRRLIDFW